MRISVLALPLWLASSAYALVVPRAVVQAQLHSATLVGEIEVQSVAVSSDREYFAKRQANTRLLHEISRHDDGGWFPAEGETFELLGVGGEIGDKGALFSGLPRPQAHRRYLAHLARAGEHSFRVTGYDAGLAPMTGSRSFSRNRTDGSNGDGEGAYLYWDDSFFPLPYFISAPTFAGLADYAAAIDASFRTWRDIEDIKVEFLPMGCSTSNRNENDGINNVILIRENWPFDPAAIAITRNFYLATGSSRPGLILDTDILLNGVDHEFSTTGEQDKYDVQDIVTHEVGHFLGLGHEVDPIDPSATMYAIADPGETNKRALHPDDLLGIHAAYLGVGNKLGPMRTTCTFPTSAEQNFGCVAVHDRSPWGLVPALLFLAALLLVGRLRFASYFGNSRATNR